MGIHHPAAMTAMNSNSVRSTAGSRWDRALMVRYSASAVPPSSSFLVVRPGVAESNAGMPK